MSTDPQPIDDSDALGNALGNAVALAQLDTFLDALTDGDPIADAICDLTNSVCHCDACHAHSYTDTDPRPHG